jgi:cell division protein FtsB
MSKEELYNKFSELFLELAKEEHQHREEMEFLHSEIMDLRTENQKLKDKNHQIANILLRD